MNNFQILEEYALRQLALSLSTLVDQLEHCSEFYLSIGNYVASQELAQDQKKYQEKLNEIKQQLGE